MEYGKRPALERPALTGFAAGVPSSAGSTSIWLNSGIAPPGVRQVRIRVGDFQMETDVEPVTGAFLVALPNYLPDQDAVSAVPDGGLESNQ